jgi:hypothetical protein
MNPGEEVSGGLVIAGGDGPELLELANEILDEMACRTLKTRGSRERSRRLGSRRHENGTPFGIAASDEWIRPFAIITID